MLFENTQSTRPVKNVNIYKNKCSKTSFGRKYAARKIAFRYSFVCFLARAKNNFGHCTRSLPLILFLFLRKIRNAEGRRFLLKLMVEKMASRKILAVEEVGVWAKDQKRMLWKRYARLAQSQEEEQQQLVTLFYCDRLGQVTRTVHVASTEDSNVVREQLHWNDSQDTLQAIDSVWHFDKLGSILLCLQVTSFADDNRTTFASSDLLQSIDAFLQRKKKHPVCNNRR